MLLQVIDPGRAVLAAGIMIVIGVAIFLFRNRQAFMKRLRGGYE